MRPHPGRAHRSDRLGSGSGFRANVTLNQQFPTIVPDFYIQNTADPTVNDENLNEASRLAQYRARERAARSLESTEVLLWWSECRCESFAQSVAYMESVARRQPSVNASPDSLKPSHSESPLALPPVLQTSASNGPGAPAFRLDFNHSFSQGPNSDAHKPSPPPGVTVLPVTAATREKGKGREYSATEQGNEQAREREEKAIHFYNIQLLSPSLPHAFLPSFIPSFQHPHAIPISFMPSLPPLPVSLCAPAALAYSVMTVPEPVPVPVLKTVAHLQAEKRNLRDCGVVEGDKNFFPATSISPPSASLSASIPLLSSPLSLSSLSGLAADPGRGPADLTPTPGSPPLSTSASESSLVPVLIPAPVWNGGLKPKVNKLPQKQRQLELCYEDNEFDGVNISAGAEERLSTRMVRTRSQVPDQANDQEVLTFQDSRPEHALDSFKLLSDYSYRTRKWLERRTRMHVPDRPDRGLKSGMSVTVGVSADVGVGSRRAGGTRDEACAEVDDSLDGDNDSYGQSDCEDDSDNQESYRSYRHGYGLVYDYFSAHNCLDKDCDDDFDAGLHYATSNCEIDLMDTAEPGSSSSTGTIAGAPMAFAGYDLNSSSSLCHSDCYPQAISQIQPSPHIHTTTHANADARAPRFMETLPLVDPHRQHHQLARSRLPLSGRVQKDSRGRSKGPGREHRNRYGVACGSGIWDWQYCNWNREVRRRVQTSRQRPASSSRQGLENATEKTAEQEIGVTDLRDLDQDGDQNWQGQDEVPMFGPDLVDANWCLVWGRGHDQVYQQNSGAGPSYGNEHIGPSFNNTASHFTFPLTFTSNFTTPCQPFRDLGSGKTRVDGGLDANVDTDAQTFPDTSTGSSRAITRSDPRPETTSLRSATATVRTDLSPWSESMPWARHFLPSDVDRVRFGWGGSSQRRCGYGCGGH